MIQPRTTGYRRSSRCALLALLLLGAGAQPLATQQVVRGWLHTIWDAEPSAASPEGTIYYLVQADGRSVRLLPTAGSGIEGQFRGLDRRQIEVQVVVETGPERARPLAVRDLGPAGFDAQRPAADTHSSARLNFITLLCRFPDDPATPVTRAQVERVVGQEYPGMGQFFAELSWTPGLMDGNRVAGWFTLPLPRAAYVQGASVDFGALTRDCAGVADAEVFFPDYFGINLQFNGALRTRTVPPYDPLSFGGSWTLGLDGQTRQYGVTWINNLHAENYVVYAHEMGHALGWPHSSGRYGNEYDSRWDLMSAGYLRQEAPYGWLSIHTIGAHKDRRGWIPQGRKWEPAPGAVESGVLTRTAQPAGTGYLMAQVPSRGSSYYTIEARRLAGHDRPLPAEAVVIHEVENGRAYVEDGGSGNPNGPGAIWQPGETFVDAANGVSVRVDSMTSTGFGVTITRGWSLSVQVTGSGVVTADRGELYCTDVCERAYLDRGGMVTLLADPFAGWFFLRWGGDCSGTGFCRVGLTQNRRINALFAQPLSILSDSVRPAGYMGAAYGDTLRAGGGIGVYSWSLASGALPPGIAFDTVSGVVSGVLEAVGSFQFTVVARSDVLSTTRSFRLTATKPVLEAGAVLDELLGSGSLTADQRRFLDLLGNRNSRLDVGDVRAWLLDNHHLSGSQAESLRSWLETAEQPDTTGGDPES